MVGEQFDAADVKIFDYWIVRRARIHVPMLYQNEGIYRYHAGVVSPYADRAADSRTGALLSLYSLSFPSTFQD